MGQVLAQCVLKILNTCGEAGAARLFTTNVRQAARFWEVWLVARQEPTVLHLVDNRKLLILATRLSIYM